MQLAVIFVWRTETVNCVYSSDKTTNQYFPSGDDSAGPGVGGGGGDVYTCTQISCKSILAAPLGSLAQVGIPGTGQEDLTGVKI